MMLPENPPTITDWMSAWGTVGALIVSLLLGFASIVLAYKDRRAKRQSERMELARAFARVETDDEELRWSITNASPYPIRQAHITAFSFVTGENGKRIIGGSAPQFTADYIEPGKVAGESYLRHSLPESLRMAPRVEVAVRLDFIDYQGTHWVRAANGKATTIEKLRGSGFEQLPRTLYEPNGRTLRARVKARTKRVFAWFARKKTIGPLR